jgi:hypothetical protein
MRQGRGVRCWGFYDERREFARCTREEHAGQLTQNRDGTYAHRLRGECRCGQVHDPSWVPQGPPRRRVARTAPPPASSRRPRPSSTAVTVLIGSLASVCAVRRAWEEGREPDDLTVLPCPRCEVGRPGDGCFRCPRCGAHRLQVWPAGELVTLACGNCDEQEVRWGLEEWGIPDDAVAWRPPPRYVIAGRVDLDYVLEEGSHAG